MTGNHILLIISLILAILAAIPLPTYGVSLGWAAFAFFIASLLVAGGFIR
jgi:hypothetical protein